MTEKSTAFEQRIERIHRLLEGEDAVVTWDDRIPDPDNPNQPRQIDVTIRRPDSFTIVECRIHKNAQDVTWIEELIGRRASLRANAVIAVSNSGFTEGAKAKAAQFGIILRDFNTLTQDEIRNWGRQRKVQLNFFEFTNNVITFTMAEPPVGRFRISDCHGELVNWRGLFEAAMRRIHDDSRTNKPLSIVGAFAHCDVEVNAPLFIDGNRTLKTTWVCDVRRITRDVLISSLVEYADPINENELPQAVVGALDLGSSEIVEAADRVALVVDLSQISIPDNYLFHTIFYDFGRVVDVQQTSFIGLQEAMSFQSSITFRFEAA